MICEILELAGEQCTSFWTSFWFSVAGTVIGAFIGIGISWHFGKKGKADLDKAKADLDTALGNAATTIVNKMEEELINAARELSNEIPARTADQVKINSLIDAIIAGAPLLIRAAIKYSDKYAKADNEHDENGVKNSKEPNN